MRIGDYKNVYLGEKVYIGVHTYISDLDIKFIRKGALCNRMEFDGPYK